MQLPIQTSLKDGTSIELDDMRSDEIAAVRALLNVVIIEGQTYPQVQPLSEEEFAAYWMSGDAFVVRLRDDLDESLEPEPRGKYSWEHFILSPIFLDGAVIFAMLDLLYNLQREGWAWVDIWEKPCWRSPVIKATPL